MCEHVFVDAHLLPQVLMEVAFRKQRRVVEEEQAEHLEQADMLARCKDL